MGSEVGSLTVLAVLGCVPPLLCLIACLQRVRRAREDGLPPGWLQGALTVSVAVFLLNIVLVALSAIQLEHAPAWTSLEAAILLIGWVALWLWIGLILSHRSRRRRKVY